MTKLIARPVPDKDIDAYFDLFNDEGLARNAGTVPYPIDMDWARDRLHTRREGEAAGSMKDRGFYESGRLVATGGYFFRGDDLEIGYSVHRNERGRGLATEIAHMIVNMVREDRHACPIVANYFTDNPASGRVLEKLGFIKAGLGTGTSMARDGDIESQRTELRGDIALVPPQDADYALLFDFQNDEEAQYQAGGGSLFDTVETYAAHLKAAAKKGAELLVILREGHAVGYLASFDRFSHREISYWIGRAYWGQGIATQAMALWLQDVAVPDDGLFARVMKDHPASARVLEKCGFERVGEDRFHSDIRGEQVEELLYRFT